MKRVKTELTGGMPFTLNELTYIQENIKETISGLAKGLSFDNPTVKIYGIDVTINDSGGSTPTADITAGLFWYLDELYFFDEVIAMPLPATYTIDEFNTNVYYDLLETTDTAVTFNDASSKNINEVRKTVLTLTYSTWIGLNYGSSNKVSETIYNTIPSTTETVEGKIQLATRAEVLAGIDINKAVTPKTLTDKIGIPLKTITMEIGDWNMVATEEINMPITGISITHTAIRNISVRIINDDNNTSFDLNTGGYYYIANLFGSTSIWLKRTDGGTFDNVAYDSTGFNRGYATITYEG